jgi:hypothetical protein
MSSSMEGRPEPLHLYAQHVSDGVVRVMHGETIVAQDNSTDYVKAAMVALKMLGHDHRTHVVLHSVSGNPAWSGSIEQHRA